MSGLVILAGLVVFTSLSTAFYFTVTVKVLEWIENKVS